MRTPPVGDQLGALVAGAVLVAQLPHLLAPPVGRRRAVRGRGLVGHRGVDRRDGEGSEEEEGERQVAGELLHGVGMTICDSRGGHSTRSGPGGFDFAPLGQSGNILLYF